MRCFMQISKYKEKKEKTEKNVIEYHQTKMIDMEVSHSVVSDFLQPHGLYSSWNSPDQNTDMGNHSLLKRSSQPKDQTQVSCIACEFFTSWATREVQEYLSG